MGSKDISKGVQFKTDISEEDKKVFDQLLTGQEENGERVLNLLRKFF
jgi:hypothetical protein